ncbi:TPA: tail fiber assembly protein [Escherichia coli]|nr:hypothetical protein [Escherichia coli]TGC00397.1 hypothetical protein CRI63_18065 [Escherichia sp. E2661]EEZ4413409.1 tail fiber assembly protein [Escherichia coli]EFO1530910.1 hypothetical protein [Escherichia coli]EGJ1954726.1 tail fiber assembly protein [Escherichia coli]
MHCSYLPEIFYTWPDYLDALEVVDTTIAPDIKWPTPPASVER